MSINRWSKDSGLQPLVPSTEQIELYSTITTSGICQENRCVKIGKCVFFTISSSMGYSFASGWNGNVAAFPLGFRPNTTLRFSSLINREATIAGDFEISTDGTCRLYAPSATSQQALFVSGMFLTE